MVLNQKPLEHFTYDLASIEGLKSVDVQISNAGAERTSPYKQLVVTVTVKTNEVTLEVPIHVSVNNNATPSLPLSPPLASEKELDDADKKALAELATRITGRGKVTTRHLLFLQKLYEAKPNTSLAEATRALMAEFKDLKITNSGVKYHLNKTLGINLTGDRSIPKPMDTTEEFFDSEETSSEIKEVPPVPGAFISSPQIQARHSYFLQELYNKYPTMPATQARDILCSKFSELNVSVQTVRDHLKNVLGMDISRKKKPEEPAALPSPPVTRSMTNQGNKILPEHTQFLQQLYKVDPELSVDEARDLLCSQFDGLDITNTDIQTWLDSVSESAPIKTEGRSVSESVPIEGRVQEDQTRAERRAFLASKLAGTGKINVDHLLFLDDLYKENPKITLSQATSRLCQEFSGLSITPSGVKYHLKHKLGLQV